MSAFSPENINSALPTQEQLPESFAIVTTNLSAIELSGEERIKYLQGQVTCDVNTIAEHGLLNGAHCDAKGKLLSVFRLIERNDSLFLLQPKNALALSLAELKKFGVFAKVDISESTLASICLVGEQAKTWLTEKFGKLPSTEAPVIQVNEATVIYLAGNTERFLVLAESEQLTKLTENLELPVFNEKVWDLLEITQGFPTLSEQSLQQYVPQMLNLDALNGISFTKGCYLGQETVARMQYLGKNKKHMTLLAGTGELPAAIEKQVGENWRSGGDIIASYQSDNGNHYLQAVVNKVEDEETVIYRSKNTEHTLTEIKLPYSEVSE